MESSHTLLTHIVAFLKQQRIVLDKSTLHYRRLDQLFCQETQRNHSMGRNTLEQVYASPNVYVVDDFVTPADLQYKQRKNRNENLSTVVHGSAPQ